MQVASGLDQLLKEAEFQNKITGNFAYLCHSASLDGQYNHGILGLKKLFPSQFKKIFGPQHGLVSDVQDNMVETDHFHHPYFDLPVYSLYSETRTPTDEMLEGLDHIIIDLQDVGTRIYTYIYTMTLTMEACAKKGIEVIVLDRPNPIGGHKIEGNLLDLNFSSFVGRHKLPTRHSLTIAEIALWAQRYAGSDCKLIIVPMKGWKREMFYEDTKLPWVLPSPNLPTIDGCFTFVGTVLFEGTTLSEGRGTTRSLEIIGHPKIKPFEMYAEIQSIFDRNKLSGFKLRPMHFLPTFQKHKGLPCGGYQIHITERLKFDSWKVSQLLCQYFFHKLDLIDFWKQPPYEYELHKNPIDLINGTDKLKDWIENKGTYSELLSIESSHIDEFISQKNEITLY